MIAVVAAIVDGAATTDVADVSVSEVADRQIVAFVAAVDFEAVGRAGSEVKVEADSGRAPSTKGKRPVETKQDDQKDYASAADADATAAAREVGG